MSTLNAASPQEPDLVEVAKSMIKAVPPSEREAVRGVGTLDLDGIAGVLAEVYLALFEYFYSRTPVTLLLGN